MNTFRTLKMGSLMASALLFSSKGIAGCEFFVTPVVTQPDCGENNGAIDLTISGGLAPYYVYWSDQGGVQGTEDRTGLGVGSLWVTVYDNSGTGCGVKVDFVLECEETEVCQFRTQTMGGWGAPPAGNNPAMYLQNHFAACFPNGITVGCNTGNTLTLTTSTAVKNFLPSGSTAMPLTQDWVNPGGSLSNVLAGQLVAAVISVTLDACEPSFGAADTWLGDAVYVDGDFSGMTVQQVIDEANAFIGGCGGSHSASQYNEALTDLNENYNGGTTNNGHIECKKGEEKSLSIPGGALNAFPNPASDRLTVSFSAKSAGNVELTVVDLTGRMVMDLGALVMERGESRELNVDLSGMQEGTYVLLATQNGQNSMQRIVVKR